MHQGRPIIGIMPVFDEKRRAYRLPEGYLKALQAQGALPLMLPLSDTTQELEGYLELCDGFLITGGQDIDPALYGEEKSELCQEPSPLRDRMDAHILTGAAERDKAVLGICRGHQMMNVTFGGTLFQDLPTQCPSQVTHNMIPPYDRPAHPVQVKENTPLFHLLQATACQVNSYHHQAVKTVAPGFEAMALADDGIVEAIYLPQRRFVWGVQWHPEDLFATNAMHNSIFRAFVSAAVK